MLSMTSLKLSPRELTQIGWLTLRGEWNEILAVVAEGESRMIGEYGHPPEGFDLFLDWLASEKHVPIPCHSITFDVWPQEVVSELTKAGIDLLLFVDNWQARKFLGALDKQQLTHEEMTVGRSSYSPYTDGQAGDFLMSHLFLRKLLQTQLTDDRDFLLVIRRRPPSLILSSGEM